MKTVLALLVLAGGVVLFLGGLWALGHAVTLWRASAWSTPPWPVFSAGCLAILAGERLALNGYGLLPE